jgi:Na+-transporting NADH:ubiquinone oxidoreductase subunit NqrA
MPRILWGNVNPEGQRSAGSSGEITTTRDERGLYTAFFQKPFVNPPAVAVTQIFPNKADDKGGDTKDNAVLVAITSQLFKVKTGDKAGVPDNRWWSFIVVGD